MALITGIFIVSLAVADQPDPADINLQVLDLIEQSPYVDSQTKTSLTLNAIPNLVDCPRYEAFLPYPVPASGGRMTVGFRCDSKPDRFAQATVRLIAPYPVVGSDVKAGSVITPEMITMNEGDLSSIPRNSIRNIDFIVGKEAVRSIMKGSPIQPSLLRPIELVESRALVDVVVAGSGFTIITKGQALSSGGLRELIRIKLDSGQVVQARIVGPGRVAVQP